MSCLGVLFAIDDDQVKELHKCKNDEELVEYVQEEVEGEWDEEWLCETDKAWDAIHRCFAGGKLELFGGKAPLNSIIFSGQILNEGTEYYVSLKSNSLVKQISGEIENIDKEELRKLYDSITDDYQGEKNEEDFEYTWEWFKGVKEFYKKIAETEKSVIFTVDQ